MSANNLFTPDQIKEMRETGAVASKVLTDSSELGKPPKASAVTIHTDAELQQGANWGSAPRVTAPGASEKIRGAKTFVGDDGKVHEVQKISAPNIDRYNQQAAARALKDIELREADQLEQAKLDPAALNNTLQALSRKVARLEKQLKGKAE